MRFGRQVATHDVCACVRGINGTGRAGSVTFVLVHTHICSLFSKMKVSYMACQSPLLHGRTHACTHTHVHTYTCTPCRGTSSAINFPLVQCHLYTALTYAHSCAHTRSPYYDVFNIIEYLSLILFATDIVLKFFVAYDDKNAHTFVTDLHMIQINFIKKMFWFDLIFWFPFSSVINQATPDAPYRTHLYVMLLNWLKLGRLYRVFIMFDHLDHSMIISQISLMLVRNFFYILMTCHWYACLMYFVAKVRAQVVFFVCVWW